MKTEKNLKKILKKGSEVAVLSSDVYPSHMKLSEKGFFELTEMREEIREKYPAEIPWDILQCGIRLCCYLLPTG